MSYIPDAPNSGAHIAAIHSFLFLYNLLPRISKYVFMASDKINFLKRESDLIAVFGN